MTDATLKAFRVLSAREAEGGEGGEVRVLPSMGYKGADFGHLGHKKGMVFALQP